MVAVYDVPLPRPRSLDVTQRSSLYGHDAEDPRRTSSDFGPRLIVMRPRFALKSVAFAERRTPFRTPFRFGSVTVNEGVQLFVHVEIEVEGKGRAQGATAD